MISLILTVLLTIPLYLLPGYLVLRLFDMRDMDGWDRFFISLCASLIIIPTLFILVGNVFHFIPGLTSYLILVTFLLVLGFVLGRLNRRPVIQFPRTHPTSLVEKISVWILLFLYTGFVNLSRLAMFVQGNLVLDVGTFDETRHLAQLVSVARTGIPPVHYLFPTISLVYYYASWIYPAILGNLPGLQVSLGRAMAIHAFIQIFGFLGLVYSLFRYNLKEWWIRLVGVAFFTVMSGFGFYAAAPHQTSAQGWQTIAGWLDSSMQIHPFSFAYAWVPQHIAGCMAFVFGLFVWRHLRASPLVKSVITGILLGFCFTTSAFIFLASGLVMLFVILFNIKGLLVNWKKSLGYLTIIGALVLMVGWYNLYLTSIHGSGFILRNFRINTVELVRGGSHTNEVIDRILTVAGFPLLAIWISVITYGLPCVLYLIWLYKRLFPKEKTVLATDSFLMAVFPPVCLFIAFYIEDFNGGGDLSMRGLMPADILITFAALLLLDEVHETILHPNWRRWIFLYLFICFFIAEGFSTYGMIRWNIVGPIKSVLAVDLSQHTTLDWQSVKVPPSAWPASLAYVHWLNQNTPTSALIIEDGCPKGEQDDPRSRWLERVRFMDPTCAFDMQWFPRDQDYIAPAQWRLLVSQAKKYPTIIAFYQSVESQINLHPVYYVDRSNIINTVWGSPVYQDRYVSIYRIN